MDNQLEELIDSIILKNHIADEKGLYSYLTKNEEVIINIEAAAASNDWVYFSEQTYDGWYCIQKNTSTPSLDVYYNERGGIMWGITSYQSKPEALASVIVKSGYAAF